MGLRFNSLPNLALRAPPRGVRFSGTFGLLRAFIFVLLGKVFAAIPGCLFSFSTVVDALSTDTVDFTELHPLYLHRPRRLSILEF